MWHKYWQIVVKQIVKRLIIIIVINLRISINEGYIARQRGEAIYVYRKFEAPSFNHCCREKQ